VEKQTKYDNLFEVSKLFDDETKNFFTWREVQDIMVTHNVTLRDDDSIITSFQGSQHHDGEYYPAEVSVLVMRRRLETGAEVAERLERFARIEFDAKERRRKQYEELRQEFG